MFFVAADSLTPWRSRNRGLITRSILEKRGRGFTGSEPSIATPMSTVRHVGKEDSSTAGPEGALVACCLHIQPISSMKTPRILQPSIAAIMLSLLASLIALPIVVSPSAARADETCSSPYLARINGQEEFVYVWTLGVEGLGDGADKLVTVDVKPGSPNYGKVISSVFRRGAQRSASRRIHRRSPPTLARGPRHQQDLHLRRPHRSGETEVDKDDR